MKLHAIARTYAHAFEGTPESMFFSTENASFKTTFSIDKSVKGMTEIYLNKDLFYSDGYKVVVTDQSNKLVSF